MDTYKLKIRIGDAEFDAEGPVDVVQAQFAAFKELMQSAPAPKAPELPETKQNVVAGTPALERILKHDGRVVSLTAHVTNLAEAILLVLVGQKSLRGNDTITGGEIIDGLRQSGHTVPRIDYQLDKLAADGLVIKIGEGRASRYRLTNQGAAKGLELAKAVIKTIDQ